VQLAPGDPVPEAATWPNCAAHERQGFIEEKDESDTLVPEVVSEVAPEVAPEIISEPEVPFALVEKVEVKKEIPEMKPFRFSKADTIEPKSKPKPKPKKKPKSKKKLPAKRSFR